jgi:hypothetical protein
VVVGSGLGSTGIGLKEMKPVCFLSTVLLQVAKTDLMKQLVPWPSSLEFHFTAIATKSTAHLYLLVSIVILRSSKYCSGCVLQSTSTVVPFQSLTAAGIRHFWSLWN